MYLCLLQVENLVTQDDRGDMSIILCLPFVFAFHLLIPTTQLLFTTFVLLMLHFLCWSDSRALE